MNTYNQVFGSFLDAIERKAEEAVRRKYEDQCVDCKQWFDKDDEEVSPAGSCVDCGSDRIEN